MSTTAHGILKQKTGFRHLGNAPQNTGFWVKSVKKPSKKPTANLIQFQFVTPGIIKDFFVYSF